MTDSNGPYLIGVDLLVNGLVLPAGFSARTYRHMCKFKDQFNRSIYMAKARIESLTFSVPGYEKRLIHVHALINGDLGRAVDEANNIFQDAYVILENELNNFIDVCSDKERVLIESLSRDLLHNKQRYFFAGCSDESKPVDLQHMISVDLKSESK